MQFILICFAVLLLVQESFCAANVTRIEKSDLYVYSDGLYIGMFMITPKGVIVVDAPPSIAGTGQTIPEIIAEYTNKPIKWVVYSHHHLDHIGAASLYPKDAEYFCHRDASTYIKLTPDVPKCTTIVKNEGYKLKIDSDHMLQLDYHGTIHTEGNLYIYEPKTKLLMLIDFVFPQWGPYHSLGMAATLAKHYEAYDKVLAYDFDYYVGGHVDRIGSRKDVTTSKQMFDDLKTALLKAVENVDYAAIVEQNGGYNGKNSFTIYRAYTDVVVDYCVDVMMNEFNWGDKLIDALAYMDTHCFVMWEYIDVNF